MSFCFYINKDQISFTSWSRQTSRTGKKDNNDIYLALPVVHLMLLTLAHPSSVVSFQISLDHFRKEI